MVTGRFGKYGLPNAGTCNDGNLDNLPEVHYEKIVGTFLDHIKFSAIKCGALGKKT